MIALHPEKRRKLVASARLLESDKPGERLAALNAITRLLPGGVTIADALALVVAPTAPAPVRDRNIFRHPSAFHTDLLRRWQRKAQTVLAFPECLNERELAFAQDMAVRCGEPTEKQQAWLDSLADRVNARAAA